MHYISNSFIVFYFVMFLSLLSCKEKYYRHDDLIYVPSEDTTIRVKISYPENWTQKNKIIVWSTSPLKTVFFPDSIKRNQDLSIDPILRTALLDSGYLNIEYIGRNDSIVYNNREYSASDAYSKAKDLENLLSYIQTINSLNNKKIVLIGHSEGGEINAMITSKNRFSICAILQLASPAIQGKEINDYQREQTGYLDFFISYGGGDQSLMDNKVNKLSSLDSYHEANIDGVKQFFKENVEPVEAFIDQFENMDSIYYHIDLYLQERWKKENRETKDLYKNDFENYYRVFAGHITPQQVTLRKFEPEKYYPFIKCPVLAVHGTEDKRIDCYPNIEKMDQLLKKGGNQNFEKMILEGYGHNLAKGSDGLSYMMYEGKEISLSSKSNLSIDKNTITEIIKWIEKQ